MEMENRLKSVRTHMKKNNISALIVPSDDPHKSEYVAEHWQARKWLTGFSGSAGTAAVTLKKAGLWTDFRYFIQAADELKNTEFELFKMGEKGVPDFEKWLMETLEKGDVIGLDGSLFSLDQVRKMKKKFETAGFSLNAKVDLVSPIWVDRPDMPISRAFLFPEKWAGQSRQEKILSIREKLDMQGADFLLMTALDDIAWTLNLRGNDVQANPVNISFLLISKDQIVLFINKEKVVDEVRKQLEDENIHILGYNMVSNMLSNLADTATILLDPETVNYALASCIPALCKVIEQKNPVVHMKAVKNPVQVSHLKNTVINDGAAVTRFLYWLEHETSGPGLTELSAAQKLYDLRSRDKTFMGNSFDAIMAWQDHSAMCHYSASADSNVSIGSKGMFLSDSGGNYLGGTTDITRTIYRGTPAPQAVLDYTMVLKGHIRVATAVFPEGTRGYQIDTMARDGMWRQGIDFGHGTGHGVGFFLCVHEGPARISPFPADVKLEKGMLLTNEPGIYRDKIHGVRLENMILVTEAFENEFGSFFAFENMTWCHFEKDLINKDLLTSEERKWLNDYHQAVYDKLSPVLEPEIRQWLKKKTAWI